MVAQSQYNHYQRTINYTFKSQYFINDQKCLDVLTVCVGGIYCLEV